ncbi:MAG: hypothetical protein COW65_15905 [Cytophagales bacterium CG18_big_fil_WC_8_21_14_2_50_42_9]|nr:MAG: hypothetical protein COW65_15905 [Cytophagales bacterium CG18_big_fil_WC_8_21_14_2_50_42_9]
MKYLSIVLFSLIASAALAQSDSASTASLTFSGFADVYYGYDFNKPQTHERPGFLYNHNRHNEFNVNLAFLKATYNAEKVRGNLALMAGTYAQYNLAAEQDLLRNIFEVNAGVRLADKLWLDAGIFSSHIGVESAVSKDNLTLTRSQVDVRIGYIETHN